MAQPRELPVYLFTGFLEAGKTKFIKETLQDPNFNDGKTKFLLITCEEGEEEYDAAILAEKNVTILTVENEEDLNPRFLMEVKKNLKVKQMLQFMALLKTQLQ